MPILMPTHFHIQEILCLTNFLRLGPLSIERIEDIVAEKPSLTDRQRNAKDWQGNKVFQQLINDVIRSLIDQGRWISTDYGFFTPWASGVWFVHHVIFRGIMQIPLETYIDIKNVDPSIGHIFKKMGYRNPFEARELKVQDLLPIRRIRPGRRIDPGERNLPKIG